MTTMESPAQVVGQSRPVSVGRFARICRDGADNTEVVSKEFVMFAGAIGLLFVDTVAGGLVLSALVTNHPTWQTTGFAWAASVSTSMILLCLWTISWLHSWKTVKVICVLFALPIAGVDAICDTRLVTLWMYGRDVAMSTGAIPPAPLATFVWWTLTSLVFFLTNCGEVGLILMKIVRRQQAHGTF